MEVILKPGQSYALDGLVRWYYGPSKYAILHAPAGFGKTFLIGEFLKKLGNRVKPLLLADTNEATNVLREVTGNTVACMTVCKALNLVPKTEDGATHLVQMQEPKLDEFNLIVVDEASTLDEEKLEYLALLDMYVLYSGHKSQLPPVVVNLKSSDDCLSPVFHKNYLTFELTEPVRHTGELFEFCQLSEQLIYKRGILPNKYKVTKVEAEQFVDMNLESFRDNESVMLAFSNKRVGELNEVIRRKLFGTLADQEMFIPTDKVILRSPTLGFGRPIPDGTNNLAGFTGKFVQKVSLTTNARGIVLQTRVKDILGIPCYELKLKVTNMEDVDMCFIYVALLPENRKTLLHRYYQLAKFESNPKLREKKWETYDLVTSIVANCKHSYALTIHCSQGSNIPNVLVDDSDIDKCRNPTLKKKLRYVAYSRTKHNLLRF